MEGDFGTPLFPILCFAMALILFTGLEIIVNLRDRGQVDAAKDRNSLRTISRLRTAAFLGGIVLFFFPIVSLPGGRSLHFYIAAALLAAAFLIRGWAVVQLGAYFTGMVMTHENQKLITDGPYHYVRHPGYSGALLFFGGWGIATGSLVGLVLILLLMGYAFHQRIKVEEEVMLSAFGEEYVAYMRKTPKLIPWLY